MSLKLTLCVPTKNRDKDIVFLLDSLLKQTYKKFKIIIVDASNNSLTKKVINNYKKKLDILYTTDYNGLTSQVNKGLRLTKSEYFMRTDDDAVFSKNVINEIIKQLENKKELGGVSVQTITPDHSSRDIFLFLSKFEKGNIFWKMIGYIYKSLIMDNQIYKISKSLPSGAFSLGGNFKKYI